MRNHVALTEVRDVPLLGRMSVGDNGMIRSLFGCLVAVSVVSTLFAEEWAARPSIGTGYTGAYTARITHVEGMEVYPSGQPSVKSFWVPVGWRGLNLEGERASGDKDTRYTGDPCDPEELVADSLKSGWPRWFASHGSFRGYEGQPYAPGITVKWDAPEDMEFIASIGLHEDDTAPSVESGSRNDGMSELLGTPQDHVYIQTTQFVELTIRNWAGQEVSNNQAGADAQSRLGLWVDSRSSGHWDFTQFCEVESEHGGQGDRLNGGVQYLHSNHHDRATGTGLKTEYHARIDKTLFLHEPPILAAINSAENWRFVQYINYSSKVRYMDGGQLKEVELESIETLPPHFHPDTNPEANPPLDEYVMAGEGNAEIAPNAGVPVDYIYAADTPQMLQTELVLLLYILADDLTQRMQFQTWVEMKANDGTWFKVTPRPQPEPTEGYPDGRPMWGFYGQCGPDSSDQWTVLTTAQRTNP